MAKSITAEKSRAKLRHAVNNMPEHGDGKDQGEDRCWFAPHS